MADQRAPDGSIMDVGHIVILMQENRSFDHYFGTLRGVRGFGDRFPIPLPGGEGRTVWQQRLDGVGLVSPFHLDTQLAFGAMRVAGTPHTWPDAQQAWNHGILDAWPSHKQGHSMGYFSRADIPFQFALADTFTICDAYHCSLQAGTNPNRVVAWSGGNDPLQQGHGPVIGNSYDNLAFDPGGGYAWTTYPERLQAAGIAWQVYQDMDDNYTDNPLVGFRAFRAAYAGAPDADPGLCQRGLSTRTLARFKADVQADALPQVSYIVATAEGSEHPVPSSPAQGAAFTAAVLEALASQPEVWRKTVLLLMFDENDGFFDHVPPPAVPSCLAWHSDPQQALLGGASTVSTLGEYHEFASAEAGESPALMHRPYGLGPRVPMYVISPWSRGGWVNSQVFDHTSVIRFMEQRFGVMEPNITPWRRAVCGDLTSAFDFSAPDPSPFMARLPATGSLAERARRLPGTVLPAVPPAAMPRQEAGQRPSRALPYQLQVTAEVTGGQAALVFDNSGQAAAVFHVYDQRRLDQIPRRYTVEPGKQLRGAWPCDGADGGYDLWVLGPNGFHRHVAGHADELGAPEVQLSYDVSNGMLCTRLHHRGPQARAFLLSPSGGEARRIVVAANASATHRWPLSASGFWYDYNVRVEGAPSYVRRFAGRMETGADGISDPGPGLYVR
jgi:phospholipase C